MVCTHHTERQSGIRRPEIDVNDQAARVLVEQLGAVDAGRLDDLAGRLSPQEMWGVEGALPTVLGLR